MTEHNTRETPAAQTGAAEPPAAQKPRRRWLQYRLRTLTGFILFLAIVGGIVRLQYDQAMAHHRAVAEIKRLDGNFSSDDEGAVISLPWNDNSPPDWKQWAFWFPGELHHVYLQDASLSDPALVARFDQLRTLSLYNTQVHDLSALQDLDRIEELFLGKTQVTDVKPLLGMTRLRWLFLNDTPVREVLPLAQLTGLRGLDLSNTRVKKEDVEELQRRLPDCYIVASGTIPK